MAYTINQKGDLIINGWENGISPDPFTGIADMRSVNINNFPQTIAAGFTITTSTISGATLGKPISKATKFSTGIAQLYYILDDIGQVFSSPSLTGTWTYLSSGATTTSASNLDSIAFYKGYLLKFRSTSIDYWNGATWVNGWNPATGGSGATGIITGSCQHFTLVGQDDVVYFCNDAFIGSIRDISVSAINPFDPTVPARYVFTTTALALPSYDSAICLAELGVQLLVGGSLNAIYPWNRSATSFTYPIFVADSYIKRMVTANQNVYIFPGNTVGRGRIYVTNGSQTDLYWKMPDHLTGYVEPYYQFGDAIWHRNNLIFGMFAAKNSDKSPITGISDIWAIDANSKALRSVSTLPVSTAKGRANVLIPDSVSGSGMSFIVGWDDGVSTPGIGYSGTTAGINGNSVIKTDIIPIGTSLDKKTFSNLQLRLATALLSGELIAVTAIEDLGARSTVVGTMTSTDGFSRSFFVNFDQSQWLQLQLTIVGNSETSGGRLKDILLN